MPYHLNMVRDWRGLLEVCNITPVFIGYLDIYVCFVSIMSYTMFINMIIPIGDMKHLDHIVVYDQCVVTDC